MSDADLPLRPAARVLLLDDADHLLLFRYLSSSIQCIA